MRPRSEVRGPARVLLSLAVAGCAGDPAARDPDAPRPSDAPPGVRPTIRLPAAPRPDLADSTSTTAGATSTAADLDAQGDAPPAESVRVAPPDTPPAAARAFARIPVAIHDGPPVGAIGQSGLHVDKIWLGSRASKSGCEGKSDGFSVASGDQVHVCFRVVHSRVEEDIDVVWEREGYFQRRRGVTIPPLHAYRGRAYLVLRGEYVGPWRVRILSSDGAELAAASFTIVD